MDVAATAEGRTSQDEVYGETPTNGTVAEEENKFQRAIAAWRNIDLTKLIPSLDNAASDIVSNQRDALVQRKDLAQKTKDFRKLDDPGKLGEIKTLLKAYQEYIDLLTNHSKTISNAFLQVYTPLSEAPDPYPLLEASVDSLVTAEETVPKLTQENEHLQKTVSKLTSQLEDTEHQLNNERKTRQSLEETRESRIKEVEASWSAVLTEKQDNWTAKERSLEEKVENQDRLLKELKASYEVNQRLGSGEGEAEGVSSGVAAELEFVSSELERANHRLAEVEGRNEQLRVELAQAASQAQGSQSQTSVEDDPAYLRLRSENSALLRKIDSARFEKDSEKRKWDTDIRGLEREVAALKADRDAMRQKLQQWGDYEDVKRELEVLKSIEFATGDEDDADLDDGVATPASSNAPASGALVPGKGETLEQLLLARNKKLSQELTVLRVSHQDLQSRLEALQEELSEANMELEKSKNLNVTLESDLVKVQQEAANAFPSSAMSVAGTYTSRYPSNTYSSRRGGGRSSPTSSIISGFDPQHGSESPFGSLRGEPVGGGSGILPMVTAQRDRFKKRNTELEAELAKTHQTVSALRSEVASLQKDNLNLYEKTRYVSSYNRAQPTSSSSAYSTNPNPSTIQVSSDSPSGLAVNDRYRSAYESNLSPFAAFRGRESARAIKRMTIPERVVFRITKMVLATRASRNLFALYCLGLHLLIFFMLFYAGTGDASGLSSTAATGPLAAVGGSVGQDAGGKEWHEEAFEGGGS